VLLMFVQTTEGTDMYATIERIKTEIVTAGMNAAAAGRAAAMWINQAEALQQALDADRFPLHCERPVVEFNAANTGYWGA
jgi:hypothetical protein